MAWLVAGLGNPDERYAHTRHNVGRMVVEELASEEGARFRRVRFLPVESAEITIGDRRVLLARSTRYMNESGTSYAGLARKHDVPPDRVIAVHDELDVGHGILRVKAGGSTAGHNGLRSLQEALRTPEFLRVRVGIGRPPGRQDPADFVLAPIPARAREDVTGIVELAASAVRSLVLEGLGPTQEAFNNRGPGGRPDGGLPEPG
jgi:peptidyl-tRNA hydrolase, PTH1 family